MKAITRTPTHTMSAWSENGRPAADVGDEPADERGEHDGDAAHRRRALLGHVVLGAAVLLAEDRLAEAPGAERRDQEPGDDQRQDPGRDAGDHHGDHGETRLAAAAGRAHDGAVVELDDAVADRLGRLVALAGDDDDVARAGRVDGQRDRRRPVRLDDHAAPVAAAATPPITSEMMAAGDSERGLSDVTTTWSASSAATAPIRGRLAWSRSPPPPNTTMTRPSVTPRAARMTCSSPSGVWA